MDILNFFKEKISRSGKDRRKSDSHHYTGQERRRSSGQKIKKGSKGEVGHRSGIYDKLPDSRKGTVDSILDILEYENLKKK